MAFKIIRTDSPEMRAKYHQMLAEVVSEMVRVAQHDQDSYRRHILTKFGEIKNLSIAPEDGNDIIRKLVIGMQNGGIQASHKGLGPKAVLDLL